MKRNLDLFTPLKLTIIFNLSLERPAEAKLIFNLVGGQKLIPSISN